MEIIRKSSCTTILNKFKKVDLQKFASSLSIVFDPKENKLQLCEKIKKKLESQKAPQVANVSLDTIITYKGDTFDFSKECSFYKIRKLKKDDLLEIARSLKLSVDKNLKKDEICEKIKSSFVVQKQAVVAPTIQVFEKEMTIIWKGKTLSFQDACNKNPLKGLRRKEDYEAICKLLGIPITKTDTKKEHLCEKIKKYLVALNAGTQQTKQTEPPTTTKPLTPKIPPLLPEPEPIATTKLSMTEIQKTIRKCLNLP